MTANEIRQTFFEFFRSKQHEIVPSAPMVMKNDPTLMFTNAGMNQFKDIFLGHSPAKYKRVANSQKCLRVTGKHNDLEEVGHDTYHHTMFEMLGNWSFGDYFKKEAIAWAWELLTEVYGIDAKNLYVTVFEGDKQDNIKPDNEAYKIWNNIVPEEKIIYGNKKDNFWEMGETGPCGPCSEIHIDLRSEEEKAKIPGKDLVNQDHPLVIEIWNLVFIEFNRMANKSLVPLPARHVDTGMGFERLCMVLQGVTSNYETDVFIPILNEISRISGKKIGDAKQTDIAMRVIADHLRAVSFSIADGQIPSNNKAGYVIRRILRRAIRYGYTFLGINEAFVYKLVDVLVSQMKEAFPALETQQELIKKVIKEEELSFLRTLEKGIQLLDSIADNFKLKNKTEVDGRLAFELYDTYGFPIDLTELILKEKGLTLSKKGFEEEMQKQKSRSKEDANKVTGDWVVLKKDEKEEFVGYDMLETNVFITKYRKIEEKDKEFYQLVFNITPFYAEAGGQVGDKGYIESDSEKINILDTKKENNLIIHFTTKLPEDVEAAFKAVVNEKARLQTASNHSATHLLHHALRQVLGRHVEQKGSLVDENKLRFDFSHYEKPGKEQMAEIEKIVNQKIRENADCNEKRGLPMDKAVEMGAMALFGEKYGDLVRVIQFGDSIELCGGTHVKSTGQIGLLKIVSESAIAAGIRRIEAITGEKAEQYFQEKMELLDEVYGLFKNTKNPVKSIQGLQEENKKLQQKLDELLQEKAHDFKEKLMESAEQIDGVKFISGISHLDANSIKNLAFQLVKANKDVFFIVGNRQGNKAMLTIAISEKIVTEKGLDAGKMIRELAKEIQGGGGGQPHFATAGGKNLQGLPKAIEKAKEIVQAG